MFKYRNSRSDSRAGFTLVEILVVILISAMLTTLIITYSNIGKDEVSLSVASVTVAQTILQTKSLAIATYHNDTGPHTCAYGVLFDSAHNTYSVVAYTPAQCPLESDLQTGGLNGVDLSEFSPGTWKLPVQQGVHLAAQGGSVSQLTLVLFYPPDPDTLLSETSGCSVGQDCTFNFTNANAVVNLLANTGSGQKSVSVSTAGQVQL